MSPIGSFTALGLLAIRLSACLAQQPAAELSEGEPVDLRIRSLVEHTEEKRDVQDGCAGVAVPPCQAHQHNCGNCNQGCCDNTPPGLPPRLRKKRDAIASDPSPITAIPTSPPQHDGKLKREATTAATIDSGPFQHPFDPAVNAQCFAWLSSWVMEHHHPQTTVGENKRHGAAQETGTANKKRTQTMPELKRDEPNAAVISKTSERSSKPDFQAQVQTINHKRHEPPTETGAPIATLVQLLEEKQDPPSNVKLKGEPIEQLADLLAERNGKASNVMLETLERQCNCGDHQCQTCNPCDCGDDQCQTCPPELRAYIDSRRDNLGFQRAVATPSPNHKRLAESYEDGVPQGGFSGSPEPTGCSQDAGCPRENIGVSKRAEQAGGASTLATTVTPVPAMQSTTLEQKIVPRACPSSVQKCPAGQHNCGYCESECCKDSLATLESRCPDYLIVCPKGQHNCGPCRDECCIHGDASSADKRDADGQPVSTEEPRPNSTDTSDKSKREAEPNCPDDNPHKCGVGFKNCGPCGNTCCPIFQIGPVVTITADPKPAPTTRASDTVSRGWND